MSHNRAYIKRVTRDMKEISESKLPGLIVSVNDTMSEFYFKILPDKDSNFGSGEFIGKMILHPKYPFVGPDFMMMTPSGRFQTNHKICLTTTAFHPEDWSPLNSVISLLVGFQSEFLNEYVKKHIGIGHIVTNSSKKKTYAKQSKSYNQKLKEEEYFAKGKTL